jgi:hypothetical protein
MRLRGQGSPSGSTVPVQAVVPNRRGFCTPGLHARQATTAYSPNIMGHPIPGVSEPSVQGGKREESAHKAVSHKSAPPGPRR